MREVIGGTLQQIQDLAEKEGIQCCSLGGHRLQPCTQTRIVRVEHTQQINQLQQILGGDLFGFGEGRQ